MKEQVIQQLISDITDLMDALRESEAPPSEELERAVAEALFVAYDEGRNEEAWWAALDSDMRSQDLYMSDED